MENPHFIVRFNGKSAFASAPILRALIVAMAHQVIALKALRTKEHIPLTKERVVG
jgi:hypothetical protein